MELLHKLFLEIKAEVGGWERYRARKKFQDQTGGFQRSTISLAKKFLTFISGDDLDNLVAHLAGERSHAVNNPRPPLSAASKHLIEDFYRSHCTPIANSTTYLTDSKTTVPSLGHKETIKSIYEEFRRSHESVKVSYSKFCNMRPKEVKLAVRQVDKCDLCLSKDCGEMKHEIEFFFFLA
jgi:hypothetical protein